MRRNTFIRLLSCMFLLAFSATAPTLAQEDVLVSQTPDLLLFADYPSRVIDIGESVTINLNLRAAAVPQIARLAVEDLPENWSATFRGDGQIVNAAFVNPETDATVELQVEPPADIEPGTYSFTALARSDEAESALPIELVVEERAPASLAFEVDLPMVRGRANTTFRFNVTLQNEGDEDLSVDLLAETAPAFNVVFKSGSQEVTNIPVKANSSERLNVEVSSLVSLVPAGVYPVTIRAQAGDVETTADLAVEVVGQPSLTLTTIDDRVSGEVEAGTETSYTLFLQNTGSAPARSIKMRATPPRDWTVTFEPEEIESIAPGEVAEVTAQIGRAH